jgi:hypothetical protein
VNDILNDIYKRFDTIIPSVEELAGLYAAANELAELKARHVGSFAWACERMLEKKVVERSDMGDHFRIGQLGSVERLFYGAEFKAAMLSSGDLTATDWRVVEETEGA